MTDPIPPELARLVVKAMTPEYRGSLWGRVYEAIANGDEDEVAAIRAEFGSPEALHAALMKESVVSSGFVTPETSYKVIQPAARTGCERGR